MRVRTGKKGVAGATGVLSARSALSASNWVVAGRRWAPSSSSEARTPASSSASANAGRCGRDQRGQLLQAGKAEVVGSCAWWRRARATRRLAMADDIDPAPVFELLDDLAGHDDATDVFDVASRDRLPVGDDGERLQHGAGVARRLLGCRRSRNSRISGRLWSASPRPGHQLHAAAFPVARQLVEQGAQGVGPNSANRLRMSRSVSGWVAQISAVSRTRLASWVFIDSSKPWAQAPAPSARARRTVRWTAWVGEHCAWGGAAPRSWGDPQRGRRLNQPSISPSRVSQILDHASARSGGRGRLEAAGGAGVGMREAQARGMQGLAWEAQRRRAAVDGIRQQRVTA